jgi:hypothetical protein
MDRFHVDAARGPLIYFRALRRSYGAPRLAKKGKAQDSDHLACQCNGTHDSVSSST